jgi:hypothetical protein
MTTGTEIICVACATDEAMSWYEIRETYARIWNRAWAEMDRKIAAEKAARVAATA